MSETIESGVLYIVSTPIGNLDDITLRAIKVLGAVDLVAAEDTRVTRFLLDHFSISKPLLSYYSYNEARRMPELLEKLKAGKSVALVTDAGTPGISDPAFALIRNVLDNHLKVVPIPGASAVLPALIVSGLSTDRFVFEGFLPLKKGRKTKFERLRHEDRTIVIYESPFRIVKTVEDVRTYLGERRIAVVRELTKKFEETVRGTASEVLEQLKMKPPRGEYVLVVDGVHN
jgi:16S rRNA (cytidine1402-2'-O)-methyltransferase